MVTKFGGQILATKFSFVPDCISTCNLPNFHDKLQKKLVFFFFRIFGIIFTNVSTQHVLPRENGWFGRVRGHPTGNGGRDFWLGDWPHLTLSFVVDFETFFFSGEVSATIAQQSYLVDHQGYGNGYHFPSWTVVPDQERNVEELLCIMFWALQMYWKPHILGSKK